MLEAVDVFADNDQRPCVTKTYGCFQKWGYPKWMVKIRENPINMDDLGVPLFLETPISS